MSSYSTSTGRVTIRFKCRTGQPSGHYIQRLYELYGNALTDIVAIYGNQALYRAPVSCRLVGSYGAIAMIRACKSHTTCIVYSRGYEILSSTRVHTKTTRACNERCPRPVEITRKTFYPYKVSYKSAQSHVDVV